MSCRSSCLLPVSGLISFSRSVDSLRKLHQKATIIDASFDPRVEPTTTRAAWSEVRDNLASGTHLHFLHFHSRLTTEAEANAQQAFVDILDNDVIKPLVLLKASEEPFILAEITLLTTGSPNRKRKTGKGSESGKISRFLPRNMQTMRRTQS